MNAHDDSTQHREQDANLPAQSAVPAVEEIRQQLSLVLQAPDFRASARTKELLRYVVEQALAGKARQLKQYTIATDVFGKDATFNPEIDPIVRLEAGKLRRALELYYFRVGTSDHVRIAIPKGSYVPAFSLNDATSMTKAPAGETGPESPSLHKMDSQRLTVLPFDSQLVDDSAKLFVSGLEEQLIVELTRYRDFSVVSESNKENPSIAGTDTGEARFSLSGSVRKSGSHFRITGRLHDAEAGSIIWTDSFDIETSEIASLAIQDRIASRIAGAIADYYGVISHALSLQAVYGPPKTWNVQDAIYRHRYLARTLTERVYRLARADLESGISHAPYHPMIWAALAHTIFYGNVLGFDEDEDWQTLVYRYVQRSFELDHRCAFAHVVTGLYQLYNRQFEDVFETCDNILAHNSHAPSSKLSAGFFRALAGDWDRGSEMLTDALATLLHPPGWAYRVTCLNHFRRGEYGKALQEINKYHAPEHTTPSLLRAAMLSSLGRADEARTAAAEVLRISPNFSATSENYFRYLIPFEDMQNALKEALRPTGLLDPAPKTHDL